MAGKTRAVRALVVDDKQDVAESLSRLLRLVAVTAYGTPEDRALSRASGFDAHVQKPVDIPMVEAMLATLFGRLAVS